jgi:hypothetical protein
MNKKLLATMIAATLSYGVASAQTQPDSPSTPEPNVPS